MTNKSTSPSIASTAGPSAPSTTTQTMQQQPGTTDQLRASWNKALVVEVVGIVWLRQAHLPKKRGVLYTEGDKVDLNVREEAEFRRLFNKEAK